MNEGDNIKRTIRFRGYPDLLKGDLIPLFSNIENKYKSFFFNFFLFLPFIVYLFRKGSESWVYWYIVHTISTMSLSQGVTNSLTFTLEKQQQQRRPQADDTVCEELVEKF